MRFSKIRNTTPDRPAHELLDLNVQKLNYRMPTEDDLPALIDLANLPPRFSWGHLPTKSPQKMIDRWLDPAVTLDSRVVVHTNGLLGGYSDLYLATPTYATVHAIASTFEAAEMLARWAGNKSKKIEVTLSTWINTTEASFSRDPSQSVSPALTILNQTGFHADSVTRRMRWDSREFNPAILPEGYQFTTFGSSMLSSLLNTYFAAWPDEYYAGDSIESIAKSFSSQTAECLCLVTYRNQEIVAYSSSDLSKDVLELDEIAVHPRHQRRGIGEALMHRLFATAGGRRVELTVLDGNPAISMYKRLGFQTIYEHTVFYFRAN